jgi:hypothetical protein
LLRVSAVVVGAGILSTVVAIGLGESSVAGVLAVVGVLTIVVGAVIALAAGWVGRSDPS